MFFIRFYDDKLAQASYLIGCESSHEAIVIDPNRDAEQYVEAAKAKALRITHVTETHIHADFVSGCRELVRRTGAALYLSGEADEEWAYRFAADDNARLLKNGDTIDVGTVRLTAWHTPGHTPEHLSFFVTDTSAADRPMGIVTGDFVFVGDVGRPDLLERAARMTGTMERAARTLYASVQEFKRQPDHLQVWPGHGAGSACGKSLSAMPHSTVGYETRFNWALTVAKEDDFVRQVLAGQPDPPKYFAEMKRVNRDGPKVLGGFATPSYTAPDALREVVAGGAIVVDTRRTADFAAGHVPRTLNIPFNSAFTTRAGWLIPYGRDVYLVVGDRAEAAAEIATSASRDLALIGLERVAGYFDVDALGAAGAAEKVPQMTSAELAERISGEGPARVTVVDVRERDEWNEGHIAGAIHAPLGHLAERMSTLERDRPLVIHCSSGGRSAIAASVLLAHGFGNVVNLSDGLTGWKRRGFPVERQAPSEEPAPATSS